MKPKFLLDEDVDPSIQRQLRRRDKRIDVIRIGDVDTLPKGVTDAQILVWAGENDYIVVTKDRSTMPSHIREHMSRRKEFAGLLWLRPQIGIGQIVEELHLIWAASEMEDYRGQAIYIPL